MTLVQNNPQVCTSALIALYHRQTEDEKEEKGTSHRNNIGFGYADVQILSSIAEQAIRNREARKAGSYPYPTDISPRQLDLVRRILPKYHRQIVDIYTERTGEVVIDDTSKASARGETSSSDTPKKVTAEPIPQPEADDIQDDNPEPDYEPSAGVWMDTHTIAVEVYGADSITPEEEAAEYYGPAETPMEFARTTEDPQTARQRRAAEEGAGWTWTRMSDGTLSCTTPAGKVYLLTREPASCSCPDFAQWGPEGVLCKHLCGVPKDETPATLTGEAYRKHLCEISPATQAEAVALVIRIAVALQGNEDNRSLMNALLRSIHRADVDDQRHAARARVFEEMNEEPTPVVEEKPARRSRVKVAA